MDKYLILENGAVFKGKSFGYDEEAVGEIVFTTKSTGYLETLSDPAYYGQIVLQTFPLIGNYGVIPQDFGPGPMHLKAYIVRDWCQEPSNFRCEGNLDSFLCEHKIPGLYGIDTRALTRVLRENGTMNAMLSKTSELSSEDWAKLKGYKIENAVAAVCDESNYSPGNSFSSKCGCNNVKVKVKKAESDETCANVAMWDFGDGFRVSELLLEYGLNPIAVNYAAPADKILEKEPAAIVLTGGPGNPAENTQIIEEIKKLCDSSKNIPIFAVGLGHQMLAIAQGAVTQKLKIGNRGSNQPVKEQAGSHAFVTKQNHGYAVDPQSLPSTAVMSYVNVNDGSCEGIDYHNIPAFSVQFEPTREIMERFKNMVEGACGNASK